MCSKAEGSTLCYLEAARVESPAGSLGEVQLQNRDDQVIGQLDGVVINPGERRLLYYVVTRPGLFRNRRYLLPAEQPAQMGSDRRTMRFDLSPEDLTSFAEFDAGKIRHLSDADTAIFAQGTSARPAA